ncbi:MAG TPA: hypothetical protein VF152_11295 [Acidimicrobiia bacterium]
MFPKVTWGLRDSSAGGGRITSCPVCGSAQVFPVSGYEDRYWCDSCARCWSLAARGATRVDPVTCPGCPHRDACFDRLRQEVGPWGPAVLD